MNFSIGISALQASQFGINQVSQNLANANTEGYHRQVLGLQTRRSQYVGNHLLGSGVEIGGVKRVRDQILEAAFTSTISDLKGIEQRLSIETRIESHFLTGEGTIQNSLTGFFDELARLSANPGEKSLRNSVVNQAKGLTYQIQEASSGLVQLKGSVSQQIDIEIEALNKEIAELVDLQNTIRTTQFQATPNSLLDQRDQLINKISEKIDVQRFESVQDSLGLGIAGSSISIGVVAIQFEAVSLPDGSRQIQVIGGDRETKFASGTIATLVDVHNNLVGEYSEKLEIFTQQLIQEVDQAHATGVGLDGPFKILRSSRNPENTTVPLNESGLPFSIENGELYISISDPSGERKLHSVAIDPSVDSLDDLAAKISAIENVQAVIDPQSGQLTVIAQPGYGFDFAGQVESNPDLGSFTGTSVPTISGDYTGAENQAYTITALGSGEIGKTPGLLAQVTDANGQVIKEINIGEGYEAGSEIDLVHGVKVSFAAGDINLDDSIETVLVANPDTANILSALGLNSFFDGKDSTDIEVKQAIVDDPDRLATSVSGDIGDTKNLARLISLRSKNTLGGGRQTFDDFLADTSSEIGFLVQSSISIQESVSELNFRYKSERDSISGVDVNEELVNLTQHQKSYEAAVQVVRTMESMLDELFQLVR
jgi:flagellar hook-associated protein FlgK